MIRLGNKRPGEVRNYRHDWTPWLGSDTIASHTTTASGVTLVSTTIEAGLRSVVFKVSAGTADTTATITHTIVTAAGETETEVLTIQIVAIDEPVSLTEAKAHLRVLHTDEDSKINAMIIRARKWVEAHTGLALIRRTFVEQHYPNYGKIRLYKGPLVSVTTIAYTDILGAAQTFTAVANPPSSVIYHSGDEWPTLDEHGAFAVTYIAGYAEGEADERLIGAMLALIEGEFAEGYAYPPRATEAAERACGYMRTMVA